MNEITIDRRTYIAATGAATAGMVGLAGCSGGEGATGQLATRVTDQPGDIADFETCVITVEGMWLGSGDAASGDSDNGDDGAESGRDYHAYEEPQTADLVRLQDETTELLDDRELAVDSYEFLQLDVTDTDATLEDGGSADVQLPGEAPLTFEEPFEIREDTRTLFTADVTPVQRGGAGGYVLQPVAEGTVVEYAEASA
jgi:hypothetical protein